jgi:hypothetical protein
VLPIVVVIGVCLASPERTLAQDVQPRVYVPVPVGMNGISLAYVYSTGALLFDKTLPVENVTGDVHSVMGAYSRSLGFFGMSARADVAVPFVDGDWTGEYSGTDQVTSRTGIADPMLRFAVFFAGAPALTRDEFASFHPKTVLGATLRIRVPLGLYVADEVINIGSNRWTFSPQLGISHEMGRLVIEAYAAAWFFTKNDEFLGTSTLSQDPIVAFQLHLSYIFRHGLWVAISPRQSVGGATSVDGGDELDPETNNRVGVTLAVPIAHRYSVKAGATTALTTTVGNDYDTLLAALQTAW